MIDLFILIVCLIIGYLVSRLLLLKYNMVSSHLVVCKQPLYLYELVFEKDRKYKIQLKRGNYIYIKDAKGRAHEFSIGPIFMFGDYRFEDYFKYL